MKLQHYLGGLEGLGPATFEKRVFVESWEKRIFGIHVTMMALSSQLPLPQTPSKFTPCGPGRTCARAPNR
jgi:nitrile hydratase